MTDSHATQARTVSTFCRICEPSCGFIAEVEGQQVTRLRPNKEHPATKGFACHKGLAFNDVHVDPDRVNLPLRRQRAESAVANSFESLDWESAIAQIGQRLNGIRERYGDGAIAGFMGNPTAFNSLAQLEVPSFFRRLGGRFFSSLTQDCANKLAGSEAVFGSSNLHPVPDLAHTDYFLCLGENPKVSHMSFYSVAEPMALMRGIVSRGGKVRYVNPRCIEAVSPATGDWQPIRPDTDLYFLAALLHAIDALDVDRRNRFVVIQCTWRTIVLQGKWIAIFPDDIALRGDLKETSFGSFIDQCVAVGQSLAPRDVAGVEVLRDRIGIGPSQGRGSVGGAG